VLLRRAKRETPSQIELGILMKLTDTQLMPRARISQAPCVALLISLRRLPVSRIASLRSAPIMTPIRRRGRSRALPDAMTAILLATRDAMTIHAGAMGPDGDVVRAVAQRDWGSL
jgi:hypothetical protein